MLVLLFLPSLAFVIIISLSSLKIIPAKSAFYTQAIGKYRFILQTQ